MTSEVITMPSVNHGNPLTVYYETDRFIREVLQGNEYGKLLDGILKETDLTVVDLGCNIGSFSLSVMDRAKDIYAVDFVTGCIDLFRRTIVENQLTNIHLFEQAIAGKNGTVKVTSLTETNGGNTIFGIGPDVPCQTLATFCAAQHIEKIDILKMDVEGAETAILTAPDFPDILGNIRVIVGEYHNGNITSVLEKLGRKYIISQPHFIVYEDRASD